MVRPGSTDGEISKQAAQVFSAKFRKPAHPLDIRGYNILGWLVAGMGVVAWLVSLDPPAPHMRLTK